MTKEIFIKILIFLSFFSQEIKKNFKLCQISCKIIQNLNYGDEVTDDGICEFSTSAPKSLKAFTKY